MKKALATFAIVVAAVAGVNAQTGTLIFSQNFAAGGNATDYQGNGANQFDGVTTSGAGFVWSIASNSMQGARTANAGALTRTTDLSLTDGAIFKFDINVADVTTAATSALQFSTGTGYTNANSSPATANIHSRFAINLTDATANSFTFRDITGGANLGSAFTGTQSVFWVVNNSGGALTYTDPNGGTSSVGNDTWDLWIGTTQIGDDRAAQTGTQGITDFKLVWDGGAGTATFDNFEVRALTAAIPEPATTALFGLGLLLGAQRLIRRKRA